jgi:hypothetical protein
MHVVELVILVVVIVGVVAAILGRDRYRGNRNRARDVGAAAPTDEVFLDPNTGERMRVWYDPSTGKREYRPAD